VNVGLRKQDFTELTTIKILGTSPGGERHRADNTEHILKVVHLYLPDHFPEVMEVYFKGPHGKTTEEHDI
jgi:hypothetical protein